jgi:hypothetical protein
MASGRTLGIPQTPQLPLQEVQKADLLHRERELSGSQCRLTQGLGYQGRIGSVV